MSKSIERINQLRAEIQKETESVKVTLAKQLNAACETFKLLTELGVTNIFRDPQYAEYVHLLNISKEPEAPRLRKRGGSGISNAEAILQVMAGGKEMRLTEIAAQVGALTGGHPQGCIAALNKLVKEKKVKKVGRGQYQKV